MMPDRAKALLERLLDDDLDEAGRRELASLAQADPALAGQVRGQHQLHHLLRSHYADATSDDLTVGRFWHQVEAGSHRVRAITDAIHSRHSQGRNHSHGRPQAHDSQQRQDRQHRRTRLMPLALAASCLLAIGILGLWWWPSDSPRSWTTDWGGSTANHFSGANPRILTADDGSTLTLAPHSRLAYSAPGRWHLAGGTVTAAIVPGGQPFAITTDRHVVEVVGTRYKVARFGGVTRVHVERGRVRVSDGAQPPQLLGAGDGTVLVEPTWAPRLHNRPPSRTGLYRPRYRPSSRPSPTCVQPCPSQPGPPGRPTGCGSTIAMATWE